jgi:methionyl-tRNA formyltransferase
LADLRSIPALGTSGKSGLAYAIDFFQPRILVSAGYDRIIEQEILNRVPRCVNVHFGMLPKYRGSYSIPWAILNNESEIAVTIHDMAPSIDDGAIIRQVRFSNDPDLSCRDLYSQAVDIGTGLVTWLVERTLMGEEPASVPQDETLATYFPPTYPGEFKVPWRQTATYAANYIRAAHFPPYDGAFAIIGRHRVIFEWPVKYHFHRAAVEPGTVVEFDSGPGIAVINGIVLPKSVKVDNRPIAFADAVRRYSLLHQIFA